MPLPTRPMVDLVIELQSLGDEPLVEHVRARLLALDPDAVVRLQLRGPGAAEAGTVLGAANLREMAPATMNISLAATRAARRPGVT